jgi:hypothetical protein
MKLKAPAVHANIKIEWERLTVTNPLAYCGTELITAAKCFTLQALGHLFLEELSFFGVLSI